MGLTLCRWGNSISTGVDTRSGLGLTITDTTLELRTVELLRGEGTQWRSVYCYFFGSLQGPIVRRQNERPYPEQVAPSCVSKVYFIRKKNVSYLWKGRIDARFR